MKTNPYVSVREIWQEIPSGLENAKNEFDTQYAAENDPFTIEVSHRPTEIDYKDETIHDYRTRILKETDDEWIDWDLSINGHTQYVSPGLGASGPTFARFRVFNTPSIGLITLHKTNK